MTQEQMKRYSLADTKTRGIIDTAKGADTGRYDMKPVEWMGVARVFGDSATEAAPYFYNYGFIKGQRAAKAAAKKAKAARPAYDAFETGNPYRDMAMDMLVRMENGSDIKGIYHHVRLLWNRRRDALEKEAEEVSTHSPVEGAAHSQARKEIEVELAPELAEQVEACGVSLETLLELGLSRSQMQPIECCEAVTA